MCSVLEFSSESDKLRTLFPSLTILILFFSYLMAAVVIKFRLPALVSIPLRTYFSFRSWPFRSSPFGLITFIPKVVISIKVLTVFVARSSDTQVPACQSRAVIFFPTAP